MCSFGNYYGHSLKSHSFPSSNSHSDSVWDDNWPLGVQVSAPMLLIFIFLSLYLTLYIKISSLKAFKEKAAIFQPLMVPLMLLEAVDRCLFQLPASPIRPSVCSPLTVTDLQVPPSLLDLQPGPCHLVARVPFILAAFLCRVILQPIPIVILAETNKGIFIFTIEVSGAYRHSYRGYINVLHHSQTNYCSLS
ncbi:hypothetical protein XENTR_v10010962 [Xenopus tropicalis]|nr:hypothetical protein XENTR_v10010962 [Xenopus tropicalis]